MTTLQSLQSDEQSIIKLVYRYAQLVDSRDAEKFTALFTADGVLDYNGRQSTGPDQLSKIPPALKSYHKTYHTVSNTLIDVDGDTATGVIYSASHHIRPIERSTYSDRVMYITYNDQYVRTDTGWKIKVRKVNLEFTEYKNVIIDN